MNFLVNLAQKTRLCPPGCAALILLGAAILPNYPARAQGPIPEIVVIPTDRPLGVGTASDQLKTVKGVRTTDGRGYIRSDGTAWIADSYYRSPPVLIPAAYTVKQIAVHGDRMLDLFVDSMYGVQRVIPSNQNPYTPLAAPPPSPSSGFVRVKSNGYFFSALRADGTLTGWGDQPTGIDWPVFSNKDIIDFAAGRHGVAAVRANGTVQFWHASGYGYIPGPPSDLVNAKAVAASEFSYIALKADGTVVVWGVAKSVPPGLSNVKAITAGIRTFAALKYDGTVVIWKEDTGELLPVPADLTGVTAISQKEFISYPDNGLYAFRGGKRQVVWGQRKWGHGEIPATLDFAEAVTTGATRAAGLTPDGKVVGWGGWNSGFPDVSAPSTLNTPIAVSTSIDHTLGLNSNGVVAAWGNNANAMSTPRGLAGVRAIAAGGTFSAALLASGKVWSWGAVLSPNADNVKAIAAGVSHGVGLRADGTVFGWGDNTYGQTVVPLGLSNVVAVAAGNSHNLALKVDGTVVTWGRIDPGMEVPTGLSKVIAIAAGDGFSLALKVDGTVAAWGSNTEGETSVPAGLTGVTAVAADGKSAIALTTEPLPVEITVNTATANAPSFPVTWTGDGCTQGSPYTPSTVSGYAGARCLLTVNPLPTSSNEQMVLDSWVDAPSITANPRSVAVQPGVAPRFTVKKQAKLTILVNPPGAGIVTGDGFYDVNATATITAKFNTGYRFTGWSGPVAAAANPSTTVQMSGPQTVTANFAVYAPKVISVDFWGSGAAVMSSGEVAGVVPRANWASAQPFSYGPMQLMDETGKLTSASMLWGSSTTGGLSGSPTAAGNARMMNGYIENPSGYPLSLSISGLPSLLFGYDVYIYSDGYNGDKRRDTAFWLNDDEAVYCTDAPNVNFGSFQRCNNGPGNYVVLSTMSTSFTINAVGVGSSGGDYRTVINGIQIVPRAPDAPAIPARPARVNARAVGIKFSGSGLPMGAPEVAGVVSKRSWNTAPGPASMAALRLRDEDGNMTNATVTWKGYNDWMLNIADAPGNARLMKGYLDDGDGLASSVVVKDLDPAPFGYSVYIYADGDNPSTRWASYSVNGVATVCRDDAGTNFQAFTPCTNQASGNYLRYDAPAGVTTFTITATPVSGARAPLNAIQFVRR